MIKFPFESLAGVKRSPTEQGAAVFTFQPAAAAKILEEYNEGNRHIRIRHAASIASAMKAMKFRLNGETVIFSMNGKKPRVVNGQHRLKACVDSGVPLTTWVVWGVPDEYYPTIDQAISKRGGDHIASMGGKNTSVAQAAISASIRCQLRQLNYPNPWGVSIQQASIAEFYGEFRDAVDAMSTACMTITSHGRSTGGTRIKTTVVGAILLPLAIQDMSWFDLARDFLIAVADGDGLSRGTPGFALRRVLSGKTKKKGADSYDDCQLGVKAWNAHARAEPMEILRFGETDDVIPYPTGPIDSNVVRDLFNARAETVS